jgi:hypothetical protein
MLALGVGPTQPLGDKPQPFKFFQKLGVKESSRFRVSGFRSRGTQVASFQSLLILFSSARMLLSEAKDISPTPVPSTP